MITKCRASMLDKGKKERRKEGKREREREPTCIDILHFCLPPNTKYNAEHLNVFCN
jgi:hypothetical protein